MSSVVTKIALPLAIGLIMLGLLPVNVQSASEPVKLELGGDGVESWNINNIKPGDIGIKTITINNAGSRDGVLSIWLSDVINSESDNRALETDSSGIGELGDHLTLNLSATDLNTNFSLPAKVNSFPQSANDSSYIRINRLAAGSTINLNMTWELPPLTGNEVQGERLSFTINYALEELPTLSESPSPSLPPGGNKGGDSGFLDVKTPGSSAQVPINKSEGVVVGPYVLTLTEIKLTLGFEANSRIICDNGEVPAQIKLALSDKRPPLPQNMILASPVYEFDAYTADGVYHPVTFDPPVRLAIDYDVEALPENTSAVFIAYYSEERQEWIQLEASGGFVASAGKAVGEVSHFSLFAVLARLEQARPSPITPTPNLPSPVYPSPIPSPPPLPSPAHFEIRNPDISPRQVQVGESTTITVQIANTGELSGEHNLSLRVNGLLRQSQVITLAPGQSLELGFTIIPDTPGSYQVEIDGVQGNFEVQATPAPVPPGNHRNQMIIIAGLILMVIVVLAPIITKRTRRSTHQ